MPLGQFILRRGFSALFSILGVSILVFAFLHLTPGDPVDQLAGGEEATEEQRREIRSCMHLDKSLPAQFGIFLSNIANGTLGQQCPNPASKPTVMARIVEVLPYTLELAVCSLFLAIIMALPLGIYAALYRGTWRDAFAAVVSLLGLSVPVMLMGPVCISIFFVWLGVLPGPADPEARFAILLPSVVIASHLMAMIARMTRSSLVEVLDEDYMMTARAKGLPESTVILKHGLRNALLPVVTIVGLQFGSLLSGAIVTEKIFARPGLGTLLLEGIRERNYPIVQDTVLIIAAFYLLVNIFVDIGYGFLDPRIRRGA